MAIMDQAAVAQTVEFMVNANGFEAVLQGLLTAARKRETTTRAYGVRARDFAYGDLAGAIEQAIERVPRAGRQRTYKAFAGSGKARRVTIPED